MDQKVYTHDNPQCFNEADDDLDMNYGVEETVMLEHDVACHACGNTINYLTPATLWVPLNLSNLLNAAPLKDHTIQDRRILTTIIVLSIIWLGFAFYFIHSIFN